MLWKICSQIESQGQVVLIVYELQVQYMFVRRDFIITHNLLNFKKSQDVVSIYFFGLSEIFSLLTCPLKCSL
jgi:hypothetical protein